MIDANPILTDLTQAIRTDDYETIEKITKKSRKWCEGLNCDGYTALQESMKHDKPLIFNKLLEYQDIVNIEVVNVFGENVLEFAIEMASDNSDYYASALIEKGAFVHGVSKNRSIVYRCVTKSSISVLKLPLVKGVDENAKNSGGYTALHQVSPKQCGSEVTNERDTEKGPFVHVVSKNDNISLIHPSVFKPSIFVLLKHPPEKGVDMNAKDSDGYTALHQVSPKQCGSEVTNERDTEKGPFVHVVSKNDNISLIHPSVFKPSIFVLLKHPPEKGVDMNAKDSDGYTALHQVSPKQCGSEVTNERDTEKEPFVHVVSKNDNISLLHRSVRKPSISVTKLLLEKGVDVNAKDSDGCTALHDVLRCCDREVTYELATILLSYGADPFLPVRGYYHLVFEPLPLCHERAAQFQLLTSELWNKNYNAFEISVIRESEDRVQEVLFFYTFDRQRSQLNLEVFLKMVMSKSPLVPCLRECNVEYIAEENGYLGLFLFLFHLKVEELRLLLQECGIIICNVLDDLKAPFYHLQRESNSINKYNLLSSDSILEHQKWLVSEQEKTWKCIYNLLCSGSVVEHLKLLVENEFIRPHMTYFLVF